MTSIILQVEVPGNAAFTIQVLEGCRQLLFYAKAGGVGRRLTQTEVNRILNFLLSENIETVDDALQSL